MLDLIGTNSHVTLNTLIAGSSVRMNSRNEKNRSILVTWQKLLPISDAFRLRDAVQMFKCMNNRAPSYLANMFQKRSQIHSYNTRNANNLNPPKCRTALAQQSFSYRGVAVWNSLPTEIRNLSSLNTFKRSMRNFLLSSWLK